MIYSNDRGSVIDSQETLHTETLKEMDRCKDHEYFYKTYCRIKSTGITKVLESTLRKKDYGKCNILYVNTFYV